MAEKGTVVVIGSGAAGSACAKRLAAAGWPVTLVDNDRWGGTCIWRGCIPKKSLFHAASVARLAASAEQFGVTSLDLRVDWQSVLAWKWHAQETYAGDQKALLAAKGIAVMDATAHFVSPDEVDLAGKRVPFEHAVIATGARPVLPEIPGVELADTSDDALRYPELPASLVIVGAGFIAMEMAGIFASFGTKVTMVVRGNEVLSGSDDDLAQAGRRGLERLGVSFLSGCKVRALEGERGRLRLTFSGADGHDGALDTERVLMAIGRRPRLAELDLDAAGIQTDSRGRLILDTHMRTTNPKVRAIGDAAGGLMHTPVANAEGRALAHSIDTGQPADTDCGSTPVCCYTVPELATVGLTERAAAEQGREIDIHRSTLEWLGAGIVADERDGFAKLIADPGGRIVGGAVAAVGASNLIYPVAVAVRSGTTLDELMATPGVHPTLSEIVFNAAW